MRPVWPVRAGGAGDGHGAHGQMGQGPARTHYESVDSTVLIRNHLTGACLYTVTVRFATKKGQEVGTGEDRVNVRAGSEETVFPGTRTTADGPFVAELLHVDRAC